MGEWILYAIMGSACLGMAGSLHRRHGTVGAFIVVAIAFSFLRACGAT